MIKNWQNNDEQGNATVIAVITLIIALAVGAVGVIMLLDSKPDNMPIVVPRSSVEHTDDTATNDQAVKELNATAQKFCDEYNAKRTNESKRPILENMDANQSTKTLIFQSGSKWQIEKDKLTGASDITGYDQVGGPNMKYVLADQDCWDQISGDGKYAYSMGYDFAYQAVTADSAKGVVFSEQGSLALLGAKGNIRLDTAAFRSPDTYSYVLTGTTNGDVIMTAKDSDGKVSMAVSGDDINNLILYQCQDFAVDSTDGCTKIELAK